MFAVSFAQKVLIKRKGFKDTTQTNCEILVFKNDQGRPKLEETYTFYNVLQTKNSTFTPLEWGRSPGTQNQLYFSISRASKSSDFNDPFDALVEHAGPSSHSLFSVECGEVSKAHKVKHMGLPA